MEADKLGRGSEFRDAVIGAFKFLVDEFSFRCVRKETTIVRFESDKVFVTVYHGRASYELNIEIGLLTAGINDQENPFTIGEIIRVVNPEESQRYHPYQVSNPASVKKFVDQLAELAKSYAVPGFVGDQTFFQRMSEARGEQSDKLILTWELNRIREEVEAAWQEKDFRRVVALYDRVKGSLTPAEAKKLEYARRNCS